MVFEFVPTSWTVPTTNTRMTANITAYSAMSWPWSSRHNPHRKGFILTSASKAVIVKHWEELVKSGNMPF